MEENHYDKQNKHEPDGRDLPAVLRAILLARATRRDHDPHPARSCRTGTDRGALKSRGRLRSSKTRVR